MIQTDRGRIPSLVACTRQGKGGIYMTRKCLDIRDRVRIVVIYKTGVVNPYIVYVIDGGHRKQLKKYGDFVSVLCFLKDMFLHGANTLPMDRLIQWSKFSN